MSDAIDPALLNFLYAFMGGMLTLLFMWLGCKIFGHIVSTCKRSWRAVIRPSA